MSRSQILQAGAKRDILRIFEAIFEAAAVVEVDFILVARIHVIAAYLPEERVEFVFVAIFFELVKEFNFFAVRLEVCPHIPMNGDDDFAFEVFGHTEDID